MKTKQTQDNTNTSTLKSDVLSRIKRDAMKPRSKVLCMCIEYSMWLLWAVTVLAGALVFSEALYVSMHAGIEFYDLTHGNLLAFVLASLPVLWIGAFGVLVFLSILHMRNTKHGYRYSLVRILGSSILLSIVFGLVFSSFGVGKYIDSMMRHMPMPYETVEDRQAYLWAHPEDGRITGMFTKFVGTSSDVIFTDVVDRDWTVRTSELSESDLELINSGEQVRLIGKVESMGDTLIFVVCSVHPWMHATDMPIESIQENREHIKKNMEFHSEVAKNKEEDTQCDEIMKSLMP